MADAAAAAAARPAPDAAASAGERLAAALQELGDALRLEAQAGRLPEEVQELAGSWGVRTQALVGALTGGPEGRLLQDAEATAAAELLQPLLGEAFVAACPDLFASIWKVGDAIAECCGEEAAPRFLGPIGASFLGLFVSKQLNERIRGMAAGPLLQVLSRPRCEAAVLAAAGAGGALDALIAAAKREGDPQQANAFYMLDLVAGADDNARERVASDAALLSVAVERMGAAAAGAASCDSVHMCQGALRLLNRLIVHSAPAAVRAQALATPGLAAAAADLLMVLGCEEWAPGAVREAWDAQKQEWEGPWEELEATTLIALALLIHAGGVSGAPSFGALAPRVLALLHSPHPATRSAASLCVAALADSEAGGDALFLVPRAALELVAVLRRAHAEGEDPRLAQFQVAHALSNLLCHSQGSRVATGLARAAAAEGGAGSLLGALAGVFAASSDGAALMESKWKVFGCAKVVLAKMLDAGRAKQLRLTHVLRRSPVVGACVHALRYWLAEASDEQMRTLVEVVSFVASLAGFDAAAAGRVPSVTEDTAAARAALLEARGMQGALRRFLSWARRAPWGDVTEAVAAAEWLLRLPEVKAPAAAPRPAESPAPAVRTAAPPAAAASLSGVQQPGNGSSSGSGHGGGGGCMQAAAPPRACGGCGKSEPEARLLRCAGCKAQHYCGDACARADWPSHRAACKAAAAAARRPSAAQRS